MSITWDITLKLYIWFDQRNLKEKSGASGLLDRVSSFATSLADPIEADTNVSRRGSQKDGETLGRQISNKVSTSVRPAVLLANLANSVVTKLYCRVPLKN